MYNFYISGESGWYLCLWPTVIECELEIVLLSTWFCLSTPIEPNLPRPSPMSSKTHGLMQESSMENTHILDQFID